MTDTQAPDYRREPERQYESGYHWLRNDRLWQLYSKPHDFDTPAEIAAELRLRGFDVPDRRPTA